MFRMFMTATTAATESALGKSLQVFWQGMLAICVVIGICIVTTVIMTHLDRKSEEKKKDAE